MPSKSLDVTRGLTTLRDEHPTAEQTDTLFRGIYRPSRRSVARPLALIATIVAAVLLLVVPLRTKSGSAWAQTMDATLSAPNSHSIYHGPGGETLVEWRSGQKRTLLRYYGEGLPDYESRSDGKRRLRIYRTPHRGPNGRQFGILDRPVVLPREYDLPFTNLPELLRQPNLKVVSHTPTDGDHLESYRLKVTKPFPEEYVAEIDPSIHRIVRLRSDRTGGEQSFDYPSKIDPAVFDPSPGAASVEVYDVMAQNAVIRRRQTKGLGKQGPVTLRLVVLDALGRLWVHWTGGLDHLKPMGVSGPIRLVGIPTSKPQGSELWFQNWRKGPTVNGSTTYSSERFARTLVVPRQKIGKAVTVEIPYPGGVARFENAPVLRIGYVYDYDFTFGDQPPGLRTRR